MLTIPVAIPLLMAITAAMAGLLMAYLYLRRQNARWRAQVGVLHGELRRGNAAVEELEKKLDEQQSWGRLLLNRTRDMVFVFEVSADGMPGDFIEVNDAVCENLHYTRERLLTMSIFDVEHSEPPSVMRAYARLHDTDSTVRGLAALTENRPIEPENVVDTRRRMKRLLADGQAVFELMLVTREGRQLPVEVHARRFDQSGRLMVVLSVLDLTERRETLQALSDSERFTRDFFAHSAIGVAIYDGERSLTNVNRIALRMFGLADQKEFAQLNIFDNPYVPAEARDSLSRGESVRFEMTLDFDDARRRGLCASSISGRAHFDIMVNNLGFNKRYEPQGYLVQVQDITAQRQIGEELKERDRQLRQAQKLQAIGTLAGGIAHDFNNIWTPVLGYAEMALDLCEGRDTQREYLREVVRASLRAKELANQILTFSRQAEPEGRPIRLLPIIKEVLALQFAALPENIRLSRLLQTERDIVIGEPSQIHQIMMNLCTNAAHAMRPDGGDLEVSFSDFRVGTRLRGGPYANLAPGNYVRISVRDTGQGIDPAVADRIFEPFFTTKERGEGTGMGLAVVHGIVTSMQGLITIETERGKGTTFHVVLPAVEKGDETPLDSESEIPGGKECILFVDDEADIVRMQLQMLASLGYQPVATHRSTEALKIYRQTPHRFALVIADQVMPEISGLDLARQIHTINPQQSILICSGFSDSLPIDKAQAFGVRDVLRKPVAKRELAQAIRRAIDDGKPA